MQTAIDEQKLWDAWETGRDLDARNRLVELHMPMVRRMAQNLRSALPPAVILDADDLASHGAMGLIDAIERFDRTRGFKFNTFATWRVRGAMLDGIQEADHLTRNHREQARRGKLDAPQPCQASELRLGSLLDRSQGPEQRMDEAEDFRDLLRGLTTRSRLMLILTYREGLTMKATGRNLGVSESRISQTHSSVIEFIRRRLGIEEKRNA